MDLISDQDHIVVIFFQKPLWATEAEVAVKGVGMIAAGGKGGLTSFPTFIGGRSPQSCTVTDFEMETSNFVLSLLISVVSVHFRAI